MKVATSFFFLFKEDTDASYAFSKFTPEMQFQRFPIASQCVCVSVLLVSWALQQQKIPFILLSVLLSPLQQYKFTSQFCSDDL